MARPTTCNIKTKPKKTLYLSEETSGLMEQCRIDVAYKIRTQVEKTLFVNALIAVGANHIDEIINKLQGKDNEQV
jgi:hypothetical protein